MADLHQLTILETLAELDRGACSAEDVTSQYIRRIDAIDGQLGAFLSLDRDQALADARAADQRRREGRGGRLLGIPVGMKDVLNVKGPELHLRFADFEGLHRAVRCDGGGPVARGGRDHHGPSEHGRVRHGFEQRKLVVSSGAQSV
jgi:hypothetical protein